MVKYGVGSMGYGCYKCGCFWWVVSRSWEGHFYGFWVAVFLCRFGVIFWVLASGKMRRFYTFLGAGNEGETGGCYVWNRDKIGTLQCHFWVLFTVPWGGTDGHLLSKLWTNIDLLRGWERVFFGRERVYYVIELIGRWYVFYGAEGIFLYGVGILFWFLWVFFSIYLVFIDYFLINNSIFARKTRRKDEEKTKIS